MTDPTPHIVVLTRCWEFHVIEGICVAARNRRTGAPVSFHEARGGQVIGSARLDEETGQWRTSGDLRLGERLAVEGTRGLFHSAPILAIEKHNRADGYRMLTRIHSTPPPAASADRSARAGLQALWARLTAPIWEASTAGTAGAAA